MPNLVNPSIFRPYARWQALPLQQALSTRRVVILSGPRQCGKTTLVKSIVRPDIIYQTLDDPTLLNAALSDPNGFVRHNKTLMIIDEIQRAPSLLQAIKQEVDENRRPGRFLLTGSANIQSLPSVTESLAGRVSNIRLRPLALGEIYGTQPDFLARAFQENFATESECIEQEQVLMSYGFGKQWTKDLYLFKALRGGFPEARSLQNEIAIRAWHRDYIEALIARDLRDIANIKRKDNMFKLIELLAAWSSKFMALSTICASVSLQRPTVESYINAVEALYLIERVRPWHKTDYERVGKHEKLFMGDTGMMAAILRWRFEKVRLDGDMNGKLLETFIFNQLVAQIDSHQNQYQLTHYRDREKREIDFIIEREDGNVLGIEVKATAVVNKSMFNHLRWFKDNILGQQTFIGIVLYTGEHIVSFGPHLWAVPMSSLWSSSDKN